jgi:urea transport system substrate-binding protein
LTIESYEEVEKDGKIFLRRRNLWSDNETGRVEEPDISILNGNVPAPRLFRASKSEPDAGIQGYLSFARPMREGLMSHHSSSVRLGFLHSFQGVMALSERSLLDAELLAVDEINASGGVLGRPIEPLVGDGCSEPHVFAREAQTLIEAGAVALLGCWTSTARKAVREVVEKAASQLWYPLQYEGTEESKHIVYTGSCPNQQILPALEWALPHLGPRIFLLGSDYVFPHTVSRLTRSLIQYLFVRAEIVGETYLPLDAQDFSSALADIRQAPPDWIFNTLNGESNLFFFRQYQADGFSPRDTPILSVSVSETELQGLVPPAVGHLAVWPYFQSLQTPENLLFIENFRHHYGPDRVCSAPMATAYCQVYLWKRAVEAAGAFEAHAVRPHLAGTTFAGPMGNLTLQANHHLALPARIGRLNEAGQFDLLWNSAEPIAPQPWMGIEDADLLHKPLLQKAMAEYAETLQYRAFLEGEIREYQHLREALERESAERRLVEEQIESFFNVALDLLCIADTKGNFLKLNQAWQNTLGYTIEELQNTPFLNLVHSDDLAATQEAMACLADQKPVRGFVNRYRCKDGSYRWIEWNSASVGQIVYAAAHDITQRKEAEDALFHSRQILEMVLDNIPQRVFWKDRDLRYMGCNRAFLANAGYTSPDAVVGKAISISPSIKTRSVTGRTTSGCSIPVKPNSITRNPKFDPMGRSPGCAPVNCRCAIRQGTSSVCWAATKTSRRANRLNTSCALRACGSTTCSR